jgi:hypothetical protein
MAYELPLDEGVRKAGWKVKIRDRERLEPPHVTILCKRRAWRLCLRTKEFLDRGDAWRQIDDEVRSAIETEWQAIRAAWDELYPGNPVQGVTDEQRDQE